MFFLRLLQVRSSHELEVRGSVSVRADPEKPIWRGKRETIKDERTEGNTKRQKKQSDQPDPRSIPISVGASGSATPKSSNREKGKGNEFRTPNATVICEGKKEETDQLWWVFGGGEVNHPSF